MSFLFFFFFLLGMVYGNMGLTVLFAFFFIITLVEDTTFVLK